MIILILIMQISLKLNGEDVGNVDVSVLYDYENSTITINTTIEQEVFSNGFE